jgi:hypothetical protein
VSAETTILLIKALHTAVFFFAAGCILYALRCGLTGYASTSLLRAAIAIPIGIGVLWWLNDGECPLSSMIYHLAAGDRTRTDIFLPDAVARWIMPVSTPLLASVVGLVLWRQFAHRWQPPRS